MTQINKILDGIVVSDKAEKTVIVSVSSRAKTRYKGCLLYTSPSPRDVEESRMPSSA